MPSFEPGLPSLALGPIPPRRLRPALLRGAMVAMALLAAMPARAQLVVLDDRADPVVATVDGEPIRQSDMDAALAELPDNLRALPPATLMPYVLDQIVGQRLVVAAARKAGMDRAPEVRRRVEAAETEALQQAWFAALLTPLLTEDAVRARFDKEVATRPPVRQAQIAQIRLETETQARAALDRLAKGEPFAEVARSVSLGPGAAEGGELGMLTENQQGLPADFLQAAFALPEGGTSAAPVQTQFGWHIIRLTNLRSAPAAEFDSMRDEIRNLIAREAVEAELVRMRAAARIEQPAPR